MKGLLKLLKKEPAMPPLADYDPVIRQIEDPERVIIPLDYPGRVRYLPLVEEGDRVRKGQAIARSRVGNCVIASISGTVKKIATVWTAQSYHSPAVIIEKGDEPPLSREEMFTGPVPAGDLKAAMERMRAAGAAPPWTLSGREYQDEGELPDLPPIETVIITGARPETTTITSQLLLHQNGDRVIQGLRRIAEILPQARVILTLPEDFRDWAGDRFAGIAELDFLPETYRARIEREVVARLIGRRIPNREHYRYHGISVLDVEYLLAMVDALDGVSPLTQKCLTISGSGIDKAVTVRFPLGSSIEHVLASVGLSVNDYTRTIVGGRMMGHPQYSGKTPLTYNNGIYLLAEDIAPFDAIAPCINCGRCTRACPADIQVHLVNRMIEYNQLDSAMELHPEACHECALCAFVCPAERPIVQLLHFCNHEMIHGQRHTWGPGGAA